MQLVAGVVAGLGIGVVAALMGVAGGELLIPTITLLYGVDVKLSRQPVAGGVAADHARRLRPVQPGRQLRRAATPRALVALMAAGSVTGSVLGGLLVGVVAEGALVPLLAALLVGSAWKVWRHR